MKLKNNLYNQKTKQVSEHFSDNGNTKQSSPAVNQFFLSASVYYSKFFPFIYWLFYLIENQLFCLGRLRIKHSIAARVLNIFMLC